jgi:phosphoglycerate kinase
MPRKMSVRDLEVRGRRVFVRVDFNVPMSAGRVIDDSRIRAALPTINLLLDRGARVVLASHLGRPKGKPVQELSLRPAAERLAELLGRPVEMAADCVGPEVEAKSRALAGGQVLLLENLRYHAGETSNDDGFAAGLAALADLYVNDAFGTAHRAHASVAGITRHLRPAASGLLVQKELEMLGRLRDRPDKPYVALLGGAKVSDKLDLIERLMANIDVLLIGGAMGHTFLKARGIPVGISKVEEDRLQAARDIMARAEERRVRLLMAIDHVAAAKPEAGVATTVTDGPALPDGMMGLDVGPRTREAFDAEIRRARTIFWNGPLGVFEVPPFDAGTRAAAQSVAAVEAFAVVGGGDSVAAVNSLGLGSRLTHLSTGGGASLEFLSGVELPGLTALTDAPGGRDGGAR